MTWVSSLSRALVLGFLFAGGCSLCSAQEGKLPEGPHWGGGNFQPTAANSVFATGDGCSLCHSAAPTARALWSATGQDVSPYGLWRGSLMAHAARDPYWKAQVAKEVSLAPDRAAELEGTCVRCHAPMGHHTNRLSGLGSMGMKEATSHDLYVDGVSCTVCHQIQPDSLGTEARFDGNADIRTGRTIFGPYADPGGQPMIMHSAFTPTQGEHIRSAGLCATCHTLRTEHAGKQFPEQSAFFEWQNSIYVDQPQVTAASRTCQQCHMPEVGPMRVARNPGGLDFNIETRNEVRGHTFVGGNAFMLDLLAANRDQLKIATPKELLEQAARATRSQLAHRTATIAVEGIKHETDGVGKKTLCFDVVVTNMTGHKFPTGFPSRRAWVQVDVREGRDTIFSSGKPDESGRINGIADELNEPHHDVITSPEQVCIYELLAADGEGKPTTVLTHMATRRKDTRLLPFGYSNSGPRVAETSPVGIGDDANFLGGSDHVTYKVAMPEGASTRQTIVARLYYQPIPPAWADTLRNVRSADAKSFVKMYDAAKAAPEQIAVTVEFAQE
ncbi:MAG: multiheme c-type cytochrome [Planctomycetota bacterium]|nr:multiheme c-type cytochrome [Planctomycetota bacterium]